MRPWTPHPCERHCERPSQCLERCSVDFLLCEQTLKASKYLMSRIWLTITLGWFLSGTRSYKKSLKSQTTTYCRTQPLRMPPVLGTRTWPSYAVPTPLVGSKPMGLLTGKEQHCYQTSRTAFHSHFKLSVLFLHESSSQLQPSHLKFKAVSTICWSTARTPRQGEHWLTCYLLWSDGTGHSCGALLAQCMWQA